ncbi:MAG: hypothetical protein ACRC46_02455 [Thermoguttaceae bacterium]
MTKKSSWDSILHEVGLAPPLTLQPSPAAEVAAAPVTPASPEPVSPPQPIAPPKTAPRRPASFGAGLIDEPVKPEPVRQEPARPEPVRPEPVREQVATPRRDRVAVSEMRVTESPVPDLVAELAATEAKSSSFFDMLPSFNIFGKKKPEPAATTQRNDDPLPQKLFDAKPPVATKPAPNPAPQRVTAPRESAPPREPRESAPPVRRETREPRERDRNKDAEQPAERLAERRPDARERSPKPDERAERSRSHRPERSLTPERAAAFADPWTDVATQLNAVAERKRGEQQPRSEQRTESTRPPRTSERGERPERGERSARPERAERGERPERSERRKPREERPKPQPAEVRTEVRGEVPSWNDAVSTVVRHNLSRRRR